MAKRVFIFVSALVVIAAFTLLLNTFSAYMPSFLAPLLSIGISLFVIGSVMFYLFKD